jgi:hypothetical protein
VRDLQVLACLAAAVFGAQPLTVEQVRAGELGAEPRRAIASWYCRSALSPSLSSARQRAATPSPHAVPDNRVSAVSRCCAAAARSGRPLRTAASISSASARFAQPRSSG